MITDEMVEKAALVLFNRMRVRRKMRPVDYIGANDTPECNECRDEARASLEAVAHAIRSAALEEAAMWHDAEITRLDDQIAENNAYMLRTRWTQMSFDANEACRDHQRAHRLSAAAIRAMKGGEG